MKQIIYQVDAFTDTLFKGNPAAVCLMEAWPEEGLMQSIAAENMLSETAFLIPNGEEGFQIRWFTPTVEVDLCGHATLASAHVLFHHEGFKGERIHFHSPRSGALMVEQTGDMLTLDFPADELKVITTPDLAVKALKARPVESLMGKSDFLLVYERETEIRAMQPDFHTLMGLGHRGLIVTAPGEEVDFVSRCFFPQSGIDEDPVTGSAHTTLTPYWSKRLGKKKLMARQLSSRGGGLWCEDCGERIRISGHAVTYLVGNITL